MNTAGKSELRTAASARPIRIAFVSPSGWGNLGDGAILESLVHAIRARDPGAEIVGFTLNPRTTAAWHGVEAYGLAGSSAPRYPVREAGDAPSAGSGHQGPPGPSLARRLLGLVPGARAAVHLLRRTVAGRRHRRRTLARLRGFDLVVVAGGGQLDGLWGGALGHPLTLHRFARMAHELGARFVVLSVGTGTLDARGARLVHRALALASYRSFRDERSRELVRRPDLTRDDPVVPDLAFAVPLPADSPPADPRTIGLSPMAYADPRVWPEPDAARYRAHVASFAALGARLARAGYTIVLFVTDSPDQAPLAELRAMLETELGPEERARIHVPEIDGVPALLRELSGCAAVVSARLHGVMLSHVAGRPALAVSHERKVRTLMEDMGHTRYCLEIEGFSPDEGWSRLQELLERQDRLAAELAARSAAARALVDRQYDLVLGSPE